MSLKFFEFLLISVLSTSLAAVHHVKRQTRSPCVMQDICGKSDNGDIPCAVQKEPHKFEDSGKYLTILKDECFELFEGQPEGYIPDVCCSPEDLDSMTKMMTFLNKTIGTKCPSCAANIKEFLCHIRCAPNQFEFMEITSTLPTDKGQMIDQLNYYITRDSMSAIFESCKQLPMIHSVMKMGGCKKDEECTVDHFTKAFGSKDVRSPVDMRVILTGKDETPIVNGQQGKPTDLMVITGDCKA